MEMHYSPPLHEIILGCKMANALVIKITDSIRIISFPNSTPLSKMKNSTLARTKKDETFSFHGEPTLLIRIYVENFFSWTMRRNNFFFVHFKRNTMINWLSSREENFFYIWIASWEFNLCHQKINKYLLFNFDIEQNNLF